MKKKASAKSQDLAKARSIPGFAKLSETEIVNFLECKDSIVKALQSKDTLNLTFSTMARLHYCPDIWRKASPETRKGLIKDTKNSATLFRNALSQFGIMAYPISAETNKNQKAVEKLEADGDYIAAVKESERTQCKRWKAGKHTMMHITTRVNGAGCIAYTNINEKSGRRKVEVNALLVRQQRSLIAEQALVSSNYYNTPQLPSASTDRQLTE